MFEIERRNDCFRAEEKLPDFKTLAAASALAEIFRLACREPENFGVPKIADVIFSPPATIVVWKDGTKTVVKAENEAYDAEKGLAMAISRKALGNKYGYYDVFRKWMKKWEGKKNT